MRELKFRAWSKSKQEMIYPDINGWFRKAFIGDNGFFQDIQLGVAIDLNGVKLELQQYAGLVDKNGNDIYEGDIVLGKKRWCDGYLTKKFPKELSYYCEIVYSGNAFRSLLVKPIAEHVEFDKEKHYREILYSLDKWPIRSNRRKDIEVVGNIYEHSHLLK